MKWFAQGKVFFFGSGSHVCIQVLLLQFTCQERKGINISSKPLGDHIAYQTPGILVKGNCN